MPESESMEVLGMVAKDVAEFPFIELAETDVALVIIEGFLEINGNLSANLCELVSW